MEKKCPHCLSSVKEKWHGPYGLQKLEKGWAEAGLSVVGRVNLRRETIVMIYVCEKTNLPFLVTLESAK